MSDLLCWMNGEVMPAEQANINVLDHGLLYGDGVFEGIRFYNGKALRLRDHMRRLLDSAKAIAMVSPLSLEELEAAAEQTIAACPSSDGYLRPVMTRGVGSLGIDPASCSNSGFFIIAGPLRMIDPEQRRAGAKVITAATRRLGADGLDPRIKSLNYLNAILARLEAKNAGADEALLLNRQGRIAEGSVDNIFIVKNGTLLTPPLSEGALGGITRAIIIELAQRHEWAFEERPLTAYDVYTADEALLCGTGAELIPVASLDGRELPQAPRPFFDRIQTAFEALVAEECA
ncbi:MAG: branched-chain-amino-acid transaminase [Gammaproteobacteria bacterium]